MEAMAVQIAYSLEDLQGDPQASMAALCQLWADELPAEYAVKVFAVRDEFLKVTLQKMYTLQSAAHGAPWLLAQMP